MTRLVAAPEGTPRLTLAQFKAMAREQYYMLLLEPEAAVEAIPKLLPPNLVLRSKVFAALQQVLSASGAIESEVESRLERIARLCGIKDGAARPATPPFAIKAERAKAS